VKYLFKANNEPYKERSFEMAIWLSSFLGMFIPCCYIQRLEDKYVLQIDFMEPEARKEVEDLRLCYKSEVERLMKLYNEIKIHANEDDLANI
jgi:hypothetical protein